MKRADLIAKVRASAARLEPVAHPGAFMERRETGDLIALFTERVGELAGRQEVIVVDSSGSLASTISALVAGVADDEIIIEGESVPVLRAHQIGIALGVAILADSASVVMDPGTSQAGLASLIVEHSIVIVSRESVYFGILEFAQSPLAAARSGYLVQVTGASRTADIEKTLVSPAHGPARLSIVVVPGAARLPARREFTASSHRKYGQP